MVTIESVRCIPLYGVTDPGSWQHQLHGPTEQIHTLIQLQDAEGRVGIGSCFNSYPMIHGALTTLEPLILGQSAVDPAAVAERLHQVTFWQGRGGAITHAISGIDIALWDLFGRVTGQPVSRLLGGRHRDRIKPYGSMHMAPPEVMGDHIRAAVERGFRAIKIGWGPFGRTGSARNDEAIIAAARAAAGPDVELMVDAGGSGAFWPHRYKWALNTARMLANYDIVWFEEPLRPDDIDAYVRLTEHSPVPIAGGEVLTRRQSFAEWVDRAAVDYIQPDVTKVGGITEQHRIGMSAYDRGVLTIGHGWNTGVGLAADLHLAAALPNARWVEYMTPSPYIESLMVSPPVLDGEGLLRIPEEPGLGFEWDLEGIERLSREPS